MSDAAALRSASPASTVAFTLGAILMALSALMLIPLLFNRPDMPGSAGAFLSSSFLCLFIGGMLYFTNRSGERRLTVRSAFILTILSWLAAGVFCALPYLFGDWQLPVTDALFESFSGLTTTGATVVIGLDNAPRDLLIWRSLTQAIGGVGIVVLAMTILPYLKVGGMQLFHAESSDRADKPIPRTAALGKALVGIYVMLVAFCFMGYAVGGMGMFDALNHALTTVATGGFSTRDASFGFFDSAFLEWIAIIFMFAGALPFVLYIRLLAKRDFAFRRDDQTRLFTAIILAAAFLLAAYLMRHAGTGAPDALRDALFTVISIITTTGFANDDYLQWGLFPVMLVFFLAYLGGCSGSTSGGLKTMRLVILMRALHRELGRLASPHRVQLVTYNDHKVEEKLLVDIMTFLCFYVTLNVVLTLALHLCGLDFETAISAAASAIANVGPGIGGTIGPAGTYASLPDSAKWLLIAGMLVGRLEILTFAVILTPAFWRD